MTHEQSSSPELGANGSAQSPEIRAAQEKVRLAREELQKAQDDYEVLRRQSAEDQPAGPATLGGLFDEVLRLARKHPLASLLAALSVGFVAGRILKR